MPMLFVAHSKALGEWGAGVGVTKELYKIGLTEEDAASPAQGLNAAACAGVADWKVIGERTTEERDEAALIARLAAKETLLDPTYYPRLKTATGIFKVKLTHVERSRMMQMALDGDIPKAGKVKPKDVADYLIRGALG